MTTRPATVGIDTSSHGFHAVSSVPILMPGGEDDDAEFRLGWSTVIAPDAQDRRRIAFSQARDFFVGLPSGSVVCVEEPIILRTNVDTTLKLTMMGGAIEAAFWQACPDATFYWVNISTWRRQVLNPPKGQAPRNKDGWKNLARKHVLDRADSLWPYTHEELAVMESQPDLWDAACIMQYGRSLHG